MVINRGGGICLNIVLIFSVNKTKCNTIQKYFLNRSIFIKTLQFSNFNRSLLKRNWLATKLCIEKLKLFGIFLTEYYD